MRSGSLNDKELFQRLLRHEGLKRLRVFFDPHLGCPVWWAISKSNLTPGLFRAGLENSYQVWGDARVKQVSFGTHLLKILTKKTREIHPFMFALPGGLMSYCVPLMAEDRLIGFLGFTGAKTGIRQGITSLLSDHIHLILDICAKSEELNRLSATIRPRAIALSTVHTVHRIINSTLNLDELVSRLAHLTAQVLRVNRCIIYLVNKPSSTGNDYLTGAAKTRTARRARFVLVQKALVGYPKGKVFKTSAVWGKGLEGRVAKTAEIVFRKKLICIPLIDEDVIGVMTISTKKDKKDFTYFDQEILTTLAEEAVIAIKNAQLYEEQKKVTLGTIQSLAVILGARMPTAMSPEIFLRLVLRVGQELRLNEEEMQALHYATLLKDTAKVGIPDEILKKPTKLTGEEYRMLRDHPIKGAKIVQSFESLKPLAPIILYSREKYDGTGYPEGLKGERIPIGARILAVVNAFEAILFGRPYRDQSSLAEALEELRRNSGTQFDPKVVEVFTHIVEKEDFYKLLGQNGRKK